MKLTTIEISHAALIFDQTKSEIKARPDRTNGLIFDIRLKRGSFTCCVPAKEIDTRDIGGPHVYQIPLLDVSTTGMVCELLDDLGIAYSKFVDSVGTEVRVNVLDLLDTHWMLYQLVDEAKIKITNGAGREHYLNFVNDGAALWATHSLVGHDAIDGNALLDALDAMGTHYEVQ